MEITYSPELRECLGEIRAIIKKYDCAAVVTLHDGLGMSEFGFLISDPTWSMVTLGEGGQVHLKLHAKSNPTDTNRTVNMLFHAHDLAEVTQKNMAQLLSAIKENVTVEVSGAKTYDLGGNRIQ